MKSSPMAGFRCNTAENFIFSLKYRQRKVELNANEKSLVSVKIRHAKFHLYVQLSYTQISYLRKNTHLRKDTAFSHFRLKESSENMMFPWNGNIRKLTKKLSFLSFSQIFIKRKLFFSCSVETFNIFSKNHQKIKHCWMKDLVIYLKHVAFILNLKLLVLGQQIVALFLYRDLSEFLE